MCQCATCTRHPEMAGPSHNEVNIRKFSLVMERWQLGVDKKFDGDDDRRLEKKKRQLTEWRDREDSLTSIYLSVCVFHQVCRECQPPVEYVRLFDVTERTAMRRHKTGRRCLRCSSALFDTIVHFGEKGAIEAPYNWHQAVEAADSADVILCLGSSLKVELIVPWKLLIPYTDTRSDTIYRYKIRYHIQIPYTEQMLSILVSHQPLVDVLVLNGSVKEFLFITHSRGRHFVWILWRLSVGFNQISWSQCASAWQVAVSFSVASLALRLMMFKSMVWEMTGWGLELMHEPILTAK